MIVSIVLNLLLSFIYMKFFAFIYSVLCFLILRIYSTTMNKKKCQFQDDWLQDLLFSGVIKKCEKSNLIAYCILCCKGINLSNMGKTALISHFQGKKHLQKMAAKKNSYGIRVFTSCSKELDIDSNPLIKENISRSPVEPEIVSEGNISIFKECTANIKKLPTPNSEKLPTSAATSICHEFDKYLLKNDVTRAEIIWCLFIISSHLSISSGGKAVQIFSKIFPDSKIASAMQLARTKISYMILYGLATYFHEKVKQRIEHCDCFVVCFDESLNKYSQKQQMDIAIRFWCTDKNEVATHYYSSAFLGHTTSEDLIQAFKVELKDLNLKKLLQVSMDGPNVNIKFFKDLQTVLSQSHDEDDPTVLFMGTCGLHVVNNAFKTSFYAVKWNVMIFLRALYNLFKNSPARRSDFLYYSGSSLMPLKFCSVRWLNNSKVAERALQMLPHLKKYKEGLEKDKKKILSYSYKIVEKSLNEKFMPVKLAFFCYVSNLIEPFLEKYQNNVPLAPYLYNDLTMLLVDLMNIFIKKEVLEKEKYVDRVDLNNNANRILSKNLKLGFVVKSELRKIKEIKEFEMKSFQNDCITVFKLICQKIITKSPIKYKLCRGITFCNPQLLSHSLSQALRRLEIVLEIFQEKKWIGSMECDELFKEFKDFCSKPEVLKCIKQFDRLNQSLDIFWYNLIVAMNGSKKLLSFLKKVLILSHGNAFVERGFSINKEVIVENQLAKSLVAQRQIYDAIQALGGLNNVIIDKQMILKVRNARSLYKEALEETKKEKRTEANENLGKKRLIDEIDELKKKRFKIITEKQRESDFIDEKIRELQMLI